MASAKDYLEKWRRLYSFPNYITGNSYLTKDGTICLNKEEDWNYAQRVAILGANAMGTYENSYLDPIPLFNNLGDIYTNIINTSFMSARTDSIKMNLLNMDFTNGGPKGVENIIPYEFFNFYGYLTDEELKNKMFSDENKEALLKLFLEEHTTLALINTDNLSFPATYEIDQKTLDKVIRFNYKINENGIRVENPVTVKDDLERYSGWYNRDDSFKNTFFEVIRADKDLSEWNRFWNKVIKKSSDESEEAVYYYPNMLYLLSMNNYKNYMSGETKGLNLLMPQYHRRVEVEDLDKNFWVISQVLDAVINALWGPYGLIDVIRQLILKVNQIEEFLGLDNIMDIELCYNGNNELYFDMYSRFLLNNLELKLKTDSGERNIKNIFKTHTELSDRDNTTDGYMTREELFLGIQTNEITPMSENFEFTGLYDSDLISSSEEIEINDKGEKRVVSLSSVIDAINDNIVNNKVGPGVYNYDIGSAHKEFFSKFDITPDGTLSPSDTKKIAEDNIAVSVGQVLSGEQVDRFSNYSKAKDYLLNLIKDENFPAVGTDEYKLLEDLQIIGKENKEDYINNVLFRQKKVLLETSSEILDENNDKKISEEEYLKYANNQIKEINKNLDTMVRAYKVYSTKNKEMKYNSLNNMINAYNSTTNKVTDFTFEGLSSSDSVGDAITTFSLLEKHCNYLDNYFYYEKDTKDSSTKVEPLYFNIYYSDKSIETSKEIYIPHFYREDSKYGKDCIDGLTKIKISDLENAFNNDIIKKDIIQILGKTENEITIQIPTEKSLFVKFSSDKNDKNTGVSDFEKIISYLSNNIRILKYKYDGTNLAPSLDNESLVGVFVYNNGEISPKSEAIYISEAIESNDVLIGSKSASIQITNYNRVGMLPSEDIYVYNLNAEKIIGTYILSDNSDPNSSEYKVQTWVDENEDIANTFFNVSDDNVINIIDAIDIDKNLNYINNAKYNKKMKDLRHKIDINENKCVNALWVLLKNLYDYNIGSDDIFNLEEVKKQIKNFLFVKKSIGTDTVYLPSNVTTPTIQLLILITNLATPDRMIQGYEITEANKPYLLESTKNVEYGLYGNILIFLFDDDYYELKFDQDGSDGDIQADDGLYIKVTDGYYTTSQPVIRYDTFYKKKIKNTNITNSGLNTKYIYGEAEDDTYALFIPRKDLIGGEIIQLRLTEKGKSKKMLDLNKLNSENGFSEWIENENVNGKNIPRSNLFLSLHNCFANNITQYNHRTALFFKDTTPEAPKINTTNSNRMLGYNSEPFKKVDDWFCNGIECEYFRPTNHKISENTVLSKDILLHKNLPIKASMICKNEPFVDNSFTFEEGPFDNPKTDEVFYTFARKQAYGAAQRHNLLYYSSPATQEGDMFIHAPSQMLVSPSLRGDESIQAPYWTGATTDVKHAYDVLKNKGDSCKLTDIKNMLYKNSRAKERRPLVIEAIWGQRNVDNYIKNKKIKYIVVEREPGSRNQTYGPNCIGFSASSGYLNSKAGITSLIEKEHWLKDCRIKWYDSNGKLSSYTPDYFPSADAKYGVIDLTKVDYKFASAFIVRFYSSNLKFAEKKEDGSNNESKNIKGEFTFNNFKNARKPIFKMVYFFGENDSGISTTKQDFIKQQ